MAIGKRVQERLNGFVLWMKHSTKLLYVPFRALLSLSTIGKKKGVSPNWSAFPQIVFVAYVIDICRT